jgi:arginyl-tRNA synthetase
MTTITQLQNLKDTKTIIYKLQSIISEVLKKNWDIELALDEIAVSKTQDPKFGDFAINIAMKLSKELSKNPRELAQVIVNDDLLKIIEISRVEIAGPGFINIFLSKDYYLGIFQTILEQKEAYGSWDVGEGEQVMVEYGHPNTHKAIQVGHMKSLLTGLAFVRILQNLDYKVVQANFFGDIGMHVARCIWGFMQKGEPENFKDLNSHEKMKYLNDCYAYGAGKYKDDEEAKAQMISINNKLYRKSDDEINELYTKTRAWSIEHQAEVFEKIGVKYDRQYPESEIEKDGSEIVKANLGNIFIVNDGAVIFPGDKYGVNTAVFITGEDNPTYGAKDIGLAYKKFSEYPKLSFNITATAHEQNSHFNTVIKALELLDETTFKGKYYHIGFGYLLRNNKKTSSRMGDTVKAVDLLKEATNYALAKISDSKSYAEKEALKIAEKVAICGLKFLILSHEIHKDINYDPDQFMNPEGFSGPYIMYGYVRAKSIFRQAGIAEVSLQNINDIEPNEHELNLLKLLSDFPKITLETGKTLSSHILCNYLFELTQSFNQFYRENKVLVDDVKVKNFRLALTQATSIVLKKGLEILGIDTIEQM